MSGEAGVEQLGDGFDVGTPIAGGGKLCAGSQDAVSDGTQQCLLGRVVPVHCASGGTQVASQAADREIAESVLVENGKSCVDNDVLGQLHTAYRRRKKNHLEDVSRLKWGA